MRKPSIFSKEYEKKMKRRKRLLIFVIIVATVGVVGGCFMKFQGFPSGIKQKIVAIFDKPKESQGNKNNNADENKKNSESHNSTDDVNKGKAETSKEEDKEIDISLPSGNTAKVTYKEENGVRMYESVAPLEQGNTFDISPTQHSLALLNGITQQLEIIDQNGNEKDLTLKSYKTRNGQLFPREEIINSFPGYKWCESAKFLNDNKIAYLSNLPWFSNGDLDTYLWIVDTETGNHQTLFNVKGKKVSIGNLTDKGLEVTIDGTMQFLTPEGQLVD